MTSVEDPPDSTGGDPPDRAGEAPPNSTVGDPAGPPTRSRWWATLAVLPFLVLGLVDVLLIVFWGVDPLWGFLILPPIVFVSAVGWVAFRSGFDRGGQ